jgi:hypothetical protein
MITVFSALLLLAIQIFPQEVPAQQIIDTAVVIDYGDPEYSEAGTWATSTSLKGFNNSESRYGSSSGASAQWTPNLTSGIYRVSFYKVVHTASDSNAKIEVAYSNGKDTQYVNQTTGTSGWLELGTYTFGAGTNGYVKYTRQAGGTGYGRTDAVKFEKLSELPPDTDITPPTAQLTEPLDTSQASLSGAITLTFNEEMNVSTLHNDNILLMETNTSSVVSTTYQVTDSNVFTLKPAQLLKPETSYTVTASTYVTDKASNALTGTRSWTFTTKSDVIETIVIDYGDPRYIESGSWATSALKGYNSSDTRYGSSSGASAQWTPNLTPGIYRVSFYKVIHASSDPNAKIEVTHLKGIDTQFVNQTTGTSGWLELGTYTFGTGTNGYVKYTRQAGGTSYGRTDAVKFEKLSELPPDTDIIPPTAQLTEPMDTAQVSLDSAIKITFDEEMDVSTLNKNNISLIETDTTSVVSATYQITNSSVFTLNPVQLLKPETSYTVTASTYVTDKAGNALSGTRSWTFTTKSDVTETIMIDYGDPGYSESGSWFESTGVRGYNNTSTRYGSSPRAYAQWTPYLTTGTYRVSLYKPVHPESDNYATIEVSHKLGVSTQNLDFTSGTSGWVVLGEYYFETGTNGHVRNTKTSSFARADAVKFEKIETSPIVSIIEPSVLDFVPIDSTFKLQFSKYMDLATLTEDRFSLTRSDGTPVSITMEISEYGKIVTLQPIEKLAYSTTYDLKVHDGLKDLESKELTGVKSWRLVTEEPDVTPPSAAITSPTTRVDLQVSTDIIITFSEPMDPATLNDSQIVLKESESGTVIDYTATIGLEKNMYTINPNSHLKYDTSYTLTISYSVKDKAGNPILPFTPFDFTTGSVSNPTSELHVSPNGNDSNSGTLGAPFATIEQAKNTVRAMNQNMLGDIKVYLHGGLYTLSDTLRWDSGDSGSNDYYVRYVNYGNESPVITGGNSITGWSQVEGSNLWKAQVGNSQFRQLYVNGKRAVRAQSTQTYNAIDYNESKNGFIIDDSIISNDWRNVDNIELTWQKAWRHSRVLVDSITPGPQPNTWNVQMKQPYFDWITTSGYKANGPNPFGFRIENAFELLDTPGEWYLDKSLGELYYWPLPSEDLMTVEVVAPHLEQLIELKGTLDEPVRSIEFKGITFRYGSWMQPSETGISTIQGDVIVGGLNQLGSKNQGDRIPGNITIHAAENISFERNRLEHLGAAGIVIENGASGIRIAGNIFTDISASAVIVGDMRDAYPVDPRQVTHDNTIENNVIYNVASEYWGSCGIFALYVVGLKVLHNEMYDLPYSGISVGWGWSNHHNSGVMKNNLIEGNHVHHHVFRLKDGGGVYTLGKQPGTVVARNLVHDQIHVFGGVYLDDGSAGLQVTENITYNVPFKFLDNSSDPSNIIVENYFGVAPTDPTFPTQIANDAGLQESYRDLLVGLPEPVARPEDPPVIGEPERTDSTTIVNGQAGYSEEGEWADSGLTGYDGINTTRYTLSEDARATWRPNLNHGYYKVSFFNVVHSNSDPNAKIDIVSGDGVSVHRVDQTTGNSGWIDLGTYYFNEGMQGYVKLTRMTAPPDNRSGFARANAIHFEKVLIDPVVERNDFENGLNWNWLNMSGTTQLTTDRDRPEGDRQVIEMRTGTALLGTALINDETWNERSLKDYAYAAHLKVPSGSIAGLLFRYTDTTRSYGIFLSPAEQKLKLYKLAGGKVTILAQETKTIRNNGWHQLKVKVKGIRIEVYLDGETVPSLVFEDGTDPILMGKVGISVIGEKARFDQIICSNYLPEVDLSLASITLSNGVLQPELINGILEYKVILPKGTTEVPTITAASRDGRTRVEITKAISLSGKTVIKVISPDEINYKRYTIYFKVSS